MSESKVAPAYEAPVIRDYGTVVEMTASRLLRTHSDSVFPGIQPIIGAASGQCVTQHTLLGFLCKIT